MKNRKSIYIVCLIMLVASVSIGYAIVSGWLNINGTAKINAAKWDIYFKNVKIKDGSVTASVAPAISNKTTVNFEVELKKPGDFYEFNVDVVNDGMIDAMIESISITPELTIDQQKYLNYSVTYADGVVIEEKDILHAQKSRTLKVNVEYLKNISNNELLSNEETINVHVEIKYVQADNAAKEPLSQEKVLDNSAPTIENPTTNVAKATKSTPIVITFQANDENEIIDTLTENDIQVKVGGNLVTPVTKVLAKNGINPITYTLTLSGINGSGELTLEIDSSKISDESGNQGETVTITPGVTVTSAVSVVYGTGANVGDELAIGDEHFYVISNDGTNITMLAKYNLNVGNICDLNNTNCIPITTSVGIQSELAKGYKYSNQYIGCVPFSTSAYWGTVTDATYVYDNRASISQYVNDYKAYLESLGTEVNEARLIKKQELANFGCTNGDYACKSAPNWLYSTAYWTGSANSMEKYVYYVSNNSSIYAATYNFSYPTGVRPVIVIPASSI